MEPFIKINGRPFPYPKRGLELVTTTFVDSARNTAGQVVGQKVGRDQYKINQCVWPVLTAEQWSAMLLMLDEFFVTVTFPDQVTNSWRSLVMYPGDRTADPYFLDEKTGLPTLYRNCRVNLIDAGYPSVGTKEANVSAGYDLQSKTVTPTTVQQVVKADPPFYGLSSVTVLPTPEVGEGKIPQKKTKTVTSNGTYSVVPDPGYELTECEFKVAVPDNPGKTPQTKYVTYRKNGNYRVTADQGRELTDVEITVDVPSATGPVTTTLPGVSRIETSTFTPTTPQYFIDLSSLGENLCGVILYASGDVANNNVSSFFLWSPKPFTEDYPGTTGIKGNYHCDLQVGGEAGVTRPAAGFVMYNTRSKKITLADYNSTGYLFLQSNVTYHLIAMYA